MEGHKRLSRLFSGNMAAIFDCVNVKYENLNPYTDIRCPPIPHPPPPPNVFLPFPQDVFGIFLDFCELPELLIYV